MQFSAKNIALIAFLALVLIGTTVLATTYAVNYFSRAAEPSPTSSFAPLPTFGAEIENQENAASDNNGLSYPECRRVSGTSNPTYDLNKDGIVNPLDCARLR